MPFVYKHFTEVLTPDECESILDSLPELDLSNTPEIDRTTEEVPIDTWYKLEKVPVRIEVTASDLIKDKLKKLLGFNFTTYDNRMYIIKYTQGESCVPHTDPTPVTAIVQLNTDFEGGVFKLNRMPIPMRLGDAIVFENENTLHSVKEVVSGVRYALALWIEPTHKEDTCLT